MFDRDADYGDSYANQYICKDVVSNKDRECTECKGKIKKGDVYESTTGRWRDEKIHFLTCQLCQEIRSVFFSSFCYGAVWEDMMNECVETEIGIGQLDQLSPAAISLLEEKLGQSWEELWYDEADQIEICDHCEYKHVQTNPPYDGWCYIFEKMMEDCTQFKLIQPKGQEIMCNAIAPSYKGYDEFPFEEEGRAWKIFIKEESGELTPPFYYTRQWTKGHYRVDPEGWVNWDESNEEGFCLFSGKYQAQQILIDFKRGGNCRFSVEFGNDFVLREVEYRKCKNKRTETSLPWGGEILLIVHSFRPIFEGDDEYIGERKADG